MYERCRRKVIVARRPGTQIYEYIKSKGVEYKSRLRIKLLEEISNEKAAEMEWKYINKYESDYLQNQQEVDRVRNCKRCNKVKWSKCDMLRRVAIQYRL